MVVSFRYPAWNSNTGFSMITARQFKQILAITLWLITGYNVFYVPSRVSYRYKMLKLTTGSRDARPDTHFFVSYGKSYR